MLFAPGNYLLPLGRKLFHLHAQQPLKELYVFSMLFSLAQSFMLIFEPVFFYQQGLPLSTISFYYALHYSLYLILLPLGGQFAARFGLERSLAVSTPLFVLYFLALAALPQQPNFFWLALFLLTLHKIFYWPAYHADLAEYSEKESRGVELSWMNLVVHGVGVLGPMVGGVVIASFGFSTLFMVAALTALISSAALLRTKEYAAPLSFDYDTPWEILTDRPNRGMVLAMLGMGENLVYLVFWPIFLYMVIGNISWFSFISAASIAVMSGVGFFVGDLTDRFHARRILKWLVPFMSFTTLLRPLIAGPWTAFMQDVVSRIAYVGVNIPLMTALYTRARKTQTLAYLTAAEMMLAMAKALTAWCLVVVFFQFEPQVAFAITFIGAAALTWLYRFLR